MLQVHPEPARPATDVEVRLPLRLSFVGGGTDLPEYYTRHGSHLICAAIDWHITVGASAGGPRSPAHRSRYAERFFIEHDLAATGWVDSEVAPGSGLGGSGAVCVGLAAIRRITEGLPVDPNSVAQEAFRWERHSLDEPVGFQDHVAAAHGGCIEVTADPDGTLTVTPRPDLAEAVQAQLDDKRLQIVPLGGTRPASALLREMADSFNESPAKPSAKPSIAELEAALLSDDTTALGELIDRQWNWKVSVTPSAAPPRTRAVLETLRAAGASGAKVMGAGASGMILVACPPENRQRLSEALAALDRRPRPASLCHRGIHHPAALPCGKDAM